MQDFVLRVLEHGLASKWPEWVVAGLVAVVMMAFGYWRGRREWRKKQNTGNITVSLNNTQEGVLTLRTLCEIPIDQALRSEVGRRLVRMAIRKTTARDPLLHFSEGVTWHLYNDVWNAIAHCFVVGTVANFVGHPCRKVRVVLALTYEHAETMRTRKLRLMLIGVEDLERVGSKFAFEQPSHTVRQETLMHIARAYREDPNQFYTVEVTFPM